MNKQNETLPSTFFPFVWYFLKNYRWLVSCYIFLALSAGFWGPFNSILTKVIIDRLPAVNAGDISILILPAMLIVINFLVLDNLTWRSIDFLNYKYEGKIKNKIIHDCFEYILGESHQFFQDNLSGRIANQITTLADNIQIILHQTSIDFLRGASLIFMSFIASYSVNPTFCLVLIIWFIFFAAFSLPMSKRFVQLADQHAGNESLVSGQLVDSIANQSNIRFFARLQFELLRFDRFLDQLLKTFKSKAGFFIILYAVQGTLIAIMMGFCVFFLVYYYKLGRVNSGDFALILGLSMNLGHMIWFTMSRVDDFNQAYGKCKQSLAALMIPHGIQDAANATQLTCKQGTISFNNVKFHYKGSTPLFQNKTITIPAGQKVGLVGYSGSGKSSFVNLILRLYDVTEGSICIDDQDIRSVTQDSLRSQIALIPQDPTLFHRSLLENIRYGKTEASHEAVIEASIKAHAHEFITKLPEQYESLVGERGVKLSGGQRQRIAIARAILKNAPILILDEATSQLDSITESLIQESLWELMENKTTLVIAHRLSTLLHMDRILVFDKGHIIEQGTHAELLLKQGLYKRLWDAQVGGFLGDSNS